MRRLLAIFAIIAFMSFGLAAVAHTYDVAVSPLIEENLLGEDHTVTVTIDPALAEGDSATVVFYIDYGPNEGEGATVDLAEGETQATFTYTGDGESEGELIDVILVEVSVNGTVVYETVVFKLWLLAKVSGGGSIIQELEDAKKKDFYKVTWGFWAGITEIEGYPYWGSINVTFHNVSNDELDKAKFVSYDITGELGLGLGPLEYLDFGNFEDFIPYPPESECNAAFAVVPGQLLDEDDALLQDECFLLIYALDGGEPNVEDAIGFELECYDETYDYDSLTDFDPIITDEPVHWLDGGDLQIVCPIYE